MTKLEECARALFKADPYWAGSAKTWEDMPPEAQSCYVANARAVIEALLKQRLPKPSRRRRSHE